MEHTASRVTRTMSGRTWDRYLETWKEEHNAGDRFQWPGDEWGSPETWEDLYTNLFVASGASSWRHAVEIGPGSGKYTERLLTRSEAVVRAYDVSADFLGVCARRCSRWVDEGRLELHLLDGQEPAELLDDLINAQLRRKVDAVFSIDAMVHVDLQYLVVYLLVAALALRPGGKLILTLSNAVSEEGFAKLLHDIGWTYPQQGDPRGSGKFEWVSPEIVRFVLTQFGFDVWIPAGEGRDLWTVATLVDPDAPERFADRLRAGAGPHL